MCCLAMAALLSCQNRPAQKTLTLMSYNVGVFSKYQDNSMPGVARLIQETGASLVGMCELDSCNTRNNTYQVKDLADMLNWSCLFSRSIPYREGAYGNGIVSAKPVLQQFCLPLPKADGGEARSMAVVETEDCVFAVTHLDHRSEAAALLQLQEINSWMAEHYSACPKPVFLCGDFNVYPDSKVIALAKTVWNQLSGEDFTFPSQGASCCIDYVFAFKDAAPVEVVSSYPITEGTADLSDHLPLLVTVKF